MNAIAQSVLDYWFTPDALSVADVQTRMSLWFNSDADLDYDIERRFGKLVSLASKGGFDSWQEEPRSQLALIILLDQFPRNLYRNSAKAFATDAKALELAKQTIADGSLDQLAPIEAVFVLMPFQHVENIDDQNTGLAAYQELAQSCPEEWKKTIDGICDFARRHHAVIEKFGRFPHRNDVLGREPTPEESVYLAEGGERF